jgi:glycosyltransferase involved in cell wall biosynthesis
LSFAQGTIFQSNYSLIDSKKLGLTIPQKTKRIINAPDSDFFHQGELLAHQKIRLIMTSWSANKNKGFDFYQYLDENLDFSQYSAVFVGNSPFEFKNIKVLKPLDSSELAFELKISDLFLTASKNDPCSNSVLEALHCGLPVIALKSGGHPELIGEAGELFVTAAEMINKIELVAKNLSYYRKRIVVKKDREICAEYFEFFKDVVGSTRPYFFSFFKVLNLYTKLLLFKIKEKLSIRN